jgi:hypothetical protein
MADYSEHFLIRGKDVSPHAKDYLSGLLGTDILAINLILKTSQIA